MKSSRSRTNWHASRNRWAIAAITCLVAALSACVNGQTSAASSLTAEPSPVNNASTPSPAAPSAASATSSEQATRKPDEIKTAYILGDSLTYKARRYLEPALSSQGWRSNPATDSRIGRMVSEGLSILADQQELPDTVLVALGTNNWLSTTAQAASWISQARAIIGPNRTLIWVNLDMAGEKYSNFVNVNQGLLEGANRDNRQLKREQAAGRTYVADWYSFAQDRRIKHSKDGVHYKQGANEQRMEFYAGVLSQAQDYLPYLKS